ncbi:zinc-dependent alcohol dehydrogenase [Glaciibacter sp. 2TAF33]|uniref:zinc-dependent alcohol dehydrogenase n=1 Tax=Glaciibacter sp. 2TAF33 TaxID=3233015 RepID=UPI003F8F835F
MDMALALVQTGAGAHELAELPIPDPALDSAILRVEANGVCGSDVKLYAGKDPAFAPGDNSRYPRVLGHEIVGTIDRAGNDFLASRGLKEGDRVAINPFLPCGRCVDCRHGDSHLCASSVFYPPNYGSIPLRLAPGLWGGYATHTYLHPNATLYPFPETTDPLDGTLWNPLAGGIQWAVLTPKLEIGQSIVVLGCGQRGLACIVAARKGGAGLIITTGLERDAHKRALALEFGADLAVNVEQEDIVDRVMELTGGRGVDIVVDTTPTVTSTIGDAVRMVRRGGTIVNVGMKPRQMDDFPIGVITTKSIAVIGNNGQNDTAHRRAAELIAKAEVPLSRMRTHVFGLDQFEVALDTLEGKFPNEPSINVVVTPTLTGA